MKVLLVEFNELTPPLMEKFISEGHLPNFARLRRESRVFTTHAEERGSELEPWIQWVTAHSGLPYRDHRVFHLGQGHDVQVPRIWDVASQKGRSVWVCGSMNAYARETMNGVFLPDPWAAQAGPQPESLRPFFRFVQANVQDHLRDGAPLKKSEYLRFLAFMVRHGLSFSTLAFTARQLLSQATGAKTRWRRAAVLDRLQLDLFRHLYKKSRPDFATFFSNSTAHFQHHFWRHMDPGAFQHKPSEQDRQSYGSAILYGYRQMDWMLGEILDLADDDTAVILCTALSQEACLTLEHLGGGVTYRPKNYEGLMRFAGITFPYTVEQAMASRFGIRFQSAADAKKAADLLDALRVGDQKAILQVDLQDEVVFLDCGFHDGPLEDLTLRRHPGDADGVRFGDIFYAYAQFNGMHNPDGMLWIRLPGKAGAVRPDKVPLTAVAPTILDLMGLSIPAEMPEKPIDLAA